jgi:hypothetical protein
MIAFGALAGTGFRIAPFDIGGVATVENAPLQCETIAVRWLNLEVVSFCSIVQFLSSSL